MAVYTPVSDQDLKAFWALYDLPALTGFIGIAQGTANTNYRVETEGGPYILTLYEKRTNPADLPFFLGLMRHLALQGLNCPAVIPARDGQLTGLLCNRPAAVTGFLQGHSVDMPEAGHCHTLGQALARLHLAGKDFALCRPNPLSLGSWQQQAAQFTDSAETLEAGLGAAIRHEVEALATQWPKALPAGAIHADLFPDNVFFTNGALSGMIDFYYACTDFWAYDLAICLNAWCFDSAFAFDKEKGHALVEGYQSVRPLLPEEAAALPVLCRGAALNFTLMRLGLWFDAEQPYRERDPRDYFRRLVFHQQIRSPADYGLKA